MGGQSNSAKFAFFYMLSLVALGFLALSVGMIVFQIINKNIVDVVEAFRSRYSPDALRFAISAIIIAGPVYFLSAWQINKNLFLGKLDKDSGVRKWLTYFIMLVAAVVAIGYLIAIINNYLSGELTLKFALKTLTALIISAIVFTYYLYDIKRDDVKGAKDKVIKAYFYGSVVIVLAVLISGLFFVESPKQARMRRQDNEILSRFSQIESAIFSYYDDNEKLPESLDEVLSSTRYLIEDNLVNPVTKQMFEYKIVTDNKFELCTEFQTSNKDVDYYKDEYLNERWQHETGYQCLEQDVESGGNEKEVELMREVPVPPVSVD